MKKKKYICIMAYIIAASTCIYAGCGSEKTLTEKKTTAASTEKGKKKDAKKAKDTSDSEKEKDSESQVSDKDSQPYSITSAKKAKAYMNQCTWDFSWDSLMRYEEDYAGQDIAFTGMVSQILDDDTLVVFDDADGDGVYADGQYYVLDERGFDTTRILEEDEIAIFGRYAGSTKVTRAVGNTETSLPEIHMYVCDFAGVELKADEETVKNMDYSPYKDILIDIEGGSYTLYDIDGDGIKELITSNGTNPANFSNTVYTMDIYGQASMIGEFYGAVSLYETEDGTGLYAVNECIGYEAADLITKSDMQLNVINLTSGEDAVDYKNESPVLTAGANDLSLFVMDNSMGES